MDRPDQAPHPWRKHPRGLLVSVRLTPRADRDAIGQVTTLSDGRSVLAARVRAVPDKGAANRALVGLIAKALKIPKADVEIVSGASARLKSVRIGGDAGTLEAGLRELLR